MAGGGEVGRGSGRKKSLAGRLRKEREGGRGRRAPAAASAPSGPARVCLRVSVSVCCALGPVRREQRRGQLLLLVPCPGAAGDKARFGGGGVVGVACACGCECARAAARNQEVTAAAHTDMFDRRDMTREGGSGSGCGGRAAGSSAGLGLGRETRSRRRQGRHGRLG